MKCFYHNDMDGKCAGAIVYNYYVREKQGRYNDFIEISYKDDFPFDIIKKGEKVVIVDFSLQKDGDFQKLLEITEDVIWIDHHVSAIEKHKDVAGELEGIRSTEKAGCELTWEYFYKDKKVPQAVKLLGDYDTWKFNYDDDTRNFQEGIKSFPCDPSWEGWKSLLESEFQVSTLIEFYIEIGEHIKRYQEQQNRNLIKSFAFEVEFEGYKGVACNQGMTNSQLFDSYEGEYELMLPFVFDGEKFTVSIYTKRDDIDCSKLASKYGGGGHKQASGFQCQELPWKKK